MITKLANKKDRSARGYTIIEVMIFLVISVTLFTTAIATFNSQNSRGRFTDSVQQVDQKIRDILNDVETGYFPTRENFSCRAIGSGAPTFPSGSAARGTNQDCTFVGKAVQLAPSETGTASYKIYTIAGRRSVTVSGVEQTVRNISEAQPRIVPGTMGGIESGNIASSVELYKVKYGSTTTDGLAIINGFGRNASSGGAARLVSGFNRVSLAAIPPAGDSSFSHSESNFVSRINSLNDSHITNARGGVTLCLREVGSGGRIAAIVIGGASRQGSTVVLFDNEAQGVCV